MTKNGDYISCRVFTAVFAQMRALRVFISCYFAEVLDSVLPKSWDEINLVEEKVKDVRWRKFVDMQ